MMLLLDTSVLIDIDKLHMPAEPLALSALTYAELRFGIQTAATNTRRQERRARLAWLEHNLGAAWLPFGVPEAESYAALASRVAPRRPRHARSKDIMLAGHALAIGARLATRNAKDFALVADQVEIVVPEML